MSTRKSEQASGWPSLVGSIHPSPNERFEADLFDRDAAECSAWGRPQTQIPKPDAVTSTLYSLQAGVFSSGVVKFDGGDGGGGALSLPGVRGDRSSSGLLEVQPMALFRPAGAARFPGFVSGGCLRSLPSVTGWPAARFGRAVWASLSLAFQGRPLSPWSMRGALFEASSERLVLVVGARRTRRPAMCPS